MSKVYVVYGNTGVYDDANSWPVKAFTSKEKMDIFLEELLKRAEKFNEKLEMFSAKHNFLKREEFLIEVRELDRFCWSDYTGIRYTWDEVDLDVS